MERGREAHVVHHGLSPYAYSVLAFTPTAPESVDFTLIACIKCGRYGLLSSTSPRSPRTMIEFLIARGNNPNGPHPGNAKSTVRVPTIPFDIERTACIALSTVEWIGESESGVAVAEFTSSGLEDVRYRIAESG